jgi:AcrR family transcriptional regulator
MAGQDGTPRAPRLTARGAVTRVRIIEAASELMYVRGVAATTLDDVMSASGTSKSQFYHHFPDKDALVREVVDLRSTRLLASQQQRLEHLDSLRGLERWRDAMVQNNGLRGGAYGCPLGSLASELADRRREVRARGHPVPDLVKVVLQVLLERLDGHAVRPGRTAVRLHLLPGLPHQLLRYGKRLGCSSSEGTSGQRLCRMTG